MRETEPKGLQLSPRRPATPAGELGPGWPVLDTTCDGKERGQKHNSDNNSDDLWLLLGNVRSFLCSISTHSHDSPGRQARSAPFSPTSERFSELRG